jgi:hypothetical protein
MKKVNNPLLIITELTVLVFLFYFVIRIINKRIKFHVNRGIGQAKQMNNNPLNIRTSDNKWMGKNTQLGDAFESFSDSSFAFRAGLVLLYNYIGMGYDTLAKMITEYAPPSDNNPTEAYIKNVSGWSGVPFDLVLTRNSFPAFAVDIISAMARQEQGKDPDAEKVKEGFDMFKNKYKIS